MAVSQELVRRGEVVMTIGGLHRLYSWDRQHMTETRKSGEKVTISSDVGRTLALQELAQRLDVMQEVAELKSVARVLGFKDLENAQDFQKPDMERETVMKVVEDLRLKYKNEFDLSLARSTMRGGESVSGSRMQIDVARGKLETLRYFRNNLRLG